MAFAIRHCTNGGRRDGEPNGLIDTTTEHIRVPTVHRPSQGILQNIGRNLEQMARVHGGPDARMRSKQIANAGFCER